MLKFDVPLRYPYRFIFGTLCILCVMAASIYFFVNLPNHSNAISCNFSSNTAPGCQSGLGEILTLNIGLAVVAIAFLWGYCSHRYEE